MAKDRPTNRTKDREKVAVWLENEQLKFLRNVQEADGVPIAEQIRRAVDLWIANRKGKLR